MTKEEIEQTIDLIMIEDGPDGHTDGADVITEFIVELQKGKGAQWLKAYEIEVTHRKQA